MLAVTSQPSASQAIQVFLKGRSVQVEAALEAFTKALQLIGPQNAISSVTSGSLSCLSKGRLLSPPQLTIGSRGQ